MGPLGASKGKTVRTGDGRRAPRGTDGHGAGRGLGKVLLARTRQVLSVSDVLTDAIHTFHPAYRGYHQAAGSSDSPARPIDADGASEGATLGVPAAEGAGADGGTGAADEDDEEIVFK
jgi:hypothetical protein